jgi:hypothetical protein
MFHEAEGVVKDFQVFDGIAVATRGDTFVSMWKSSASLLRVRWHGALIEQHVAKQGGNALCLMIILPTAAPPQGEARIESNALVKRIAPKLRLAVTAPLGDTLQIQVVRTIMRGMFLLSGNAKRHVIVSTEAQGVDRILAVAEATTPPRAVLEAAIRSSHEALDANETFGGARIVSS